MKNEKAIKELMEITGSTLSLEDVVTYQDGDIVCLDGMSEYLVIDEIYVHNRLKDVVKETASYFRESFLSQMTDLPIGVFIALTKESDHETVYKLIDKFCGVDNFIEEMVRVDGVGHFLSNYDGEEIELSDCMFAYRVN